MWRKQRLHMDIVILPLVRNLAFTLKNVGAVADLLLVRVGSLKKIKIKKNTSKVLAFGDVVSKVRPRLARGPWKSDVRKSVLCICCAAVHLDFAFGIA
jgi:hypothetical protein